MKNIKEVRQNNNIDIRGGKNKNCKIISEKIRYHYENYILL